MELQTIKDYVLSADEISFPALQKQFSLPYGKAKAVLDALVSDGTLEYAFGVTYKVKKRKKEEEEEQRPTYVPENEEEKTYIKLLWECIRWGVASVYNLAHSYGVAFFTANRAISWMREQGFVEPAPSRKVLITQEEFLKRFGKALTGGKDADKATNDETKDDEGDGETEIDEHLADFKTIMRICFEHGLCQIGNDHCCVLGLNGDFDFMLKLVRDGDALRISDDGQTVARSDKTRRKIQNALKSYAPVTLEGDEICITAANASGSLMALLTLYSAVEAVKRIK